MALVGQGRAAVRLAQPRIRQQDAEAAAGVAPCEAGDLHGQAHVVSEAVDLLGRLGHDDEPARGADHDLLAQEGAPAADQAEVGRDLVGAVQGGRPSRTVSCPGR